MKILHATALLIATALHAAHADEQPVIAQRGDGLIVLNPEAAAMVMTDKAGRHPMNATNPKLRLEGGRYVNVGEGFQFPGWKFRVDKPGKFEVLMDLGTQRSERTELRLSFYQGARESRLVGGVPRRRDDGEPFSLGVTSLGEGEFEAAVIIWGADHPRRLPDVGTVVLVPVPADEEKAFAELVRKSPLARNQETSAIEETLRAATAELGRLKAAWSPKAGPFSDYEKMAAWDRDGRRIRELEPLVSESTRRLEAARLAALEANRSKLTDAEKQVLDARLAPRALWKAALADSRSGPVFAAKPDGPPPLFPTGGLDQVKPEDFSKARVFAFEVPPPADASARAAAFAARNSPAGIEALSRRLHAALRPGVPGLEAYYAAFEAGKHQEALDAYRDFFFRKLKSPEQYGAAGISFTDDFFQAGGKWLNLRAPQPDWLAANLQGTAVFPLNGVVMKGHVGPPGQVNWAPDNLKPPEGVGFGRGPDGSTFWKTDAGRDLNLQIEFFRGFNRHPGQGGASAVFPDLLLSYCFTGNRDHLNLYAGYWDDWAMNSVRDVESCPVNVRAATELQVVGWFRTLLRTVLDERPEFARDFPSATLARMMMALTEIYHPYVIRAKRSEIANWGIMGVDAGLNDSKLFNEFRSMEYTNREFLRLARINGIQHLSLDGENLESWDEGHVAIDGMLSRAPALKLHDAPVMGDLETISLRDHLKVMQRTLMTHFSPDGNYWVSWLPEEDPGRKMIRGKIIERGLISDILDEPEVRSRFDAALGRGPTRRTPPLSDIQPYAQLAYLRDGFGGNSTSLVFQNFPVRSQTQDWGYNTKRGHLVGSMRTQYGVARDGRGLLEASAILVDSKPPNIFVDATPTGGKTDFSMPTPRNIVPSRFLAAADFDVLESSHDAPFRRFGFGYGKELLGLLQVTPDEPVRGIRATRQIIQFRGEGVFLIGDRIENSGPAREFAQMFVLPLRLPGPPALEPERLRLLAQKDAVLLEVNPEKNLARSLSPGLPNVSLHVAGHDFKWGGKSLGGNRYEAQGTISARALLSKASSSKNSKQPAISQPLVPVSVRWQGEGNQALASVVQARPASDSPDEAAEIQNFREMNGPDGVAGFSFRTPSGREVWYQIAPGPQAGLTAGPASANAGSLMATRLNGGISGVVMNSQTVTINGKSYQGPADAFVFRLDAGGAFESEAVLPPIDTVVISPQQTVFIDRVKVSFDIPTQSRDDLEFRYTLDGSDPTLASTLYSGPFELTSDAIVKVRAFRKGLKETPWNIAGVDGSKTISAIFRKTGPLPAAQPGTLEPGLSYEYFEDSWPVLLSHSGMYPLLPVKAAGQAAALLDPEQLAEIRKTDRAYAVKYRGYIEIPETGVYRFFAPDPLYNTTKDAGYELRVWIDGQEWLPNPDLHAENIWSVALEKGLHRFEVSYVDFRWKTFRNEYWMSWNPLQMWEGTPVLEVESAGFKRQPLPAAWLRRTP